MAFTSHEIVPAPSGSYDVIKNLAEYRVDYRLTTNSASDGPQKAIAYAEAKIAAVGASYAVGNDVRPGCWLRNWEARREANSLYVWIATAIYRDEDPEDSEDSNSGYDMNGNPTDNPLDFRPVIDVQDTQYMRPVWGAVYKSGFSGVAHNKLNDGKRRPIVNSALTVYDPPPEADHARWTVTIERNLSAIRCDTVPLNCINSVGLTLKYRGIEKEIPQHCGKLRGFRATPMRHDKFGDYVRVTLSIEVYNDADETWLFKILDQGLSARAMLGDPDGHGGAVYENSMAFVEEMAPQRRLVDLDGLPLSSPVLLNGDGQPLEQYKDPNNPKDPVYSTWEYYTEQDWRLWPILQGLLG